MAKVPQGLGKVMHASPSKAHMQWPKFKLLSHILLASIGT